MTMQDAIHSELRTIESSEDVRVLYACESGSRAWGFASPDSDYDVRFVYVHSPAWYLRLSRGRDVIEWKLDETLDIVGWDAAKLLRLMRNSNPSVYEWLASPIVYRELAEFGPVRELAARSFQVRPGAHHYFHMASRNYREYLQGKLVRVKKYFYVIRPLLAARWVLEERTAPPMLFSELVEAKLDTGVLSLVGALLQEKAATAELGERPRIDALNAWIEVGLAELEARIPEIPKQQKLPWQEFDEVFLDLLKQ